eukprot:4197099-Prymnesium_polylepis.1
MHTRARARWKPRGFCQWFSRCARPRQKRSSRPGTRAAGARRGAAGSRCGARQTRKSDAARTDGAPKA